MTMPDRILAASAALAQPSRFPATGTSPATRAEHDRMANAIRPLANDAVDHTSYVLASEGDVMEGIRQEAMARAGHLKLKKLIVLFDDTGISIDGPLALADSVDQVKPFESAGWAATRIDGHDPAAIAAALEAAKTSERPSLIACRTTIGFGAPTKAGTAKAAGSP